MLAFFNFSPLELIILLAGGLVCFIGVPAAGVLVFLLTRTRVTPPEEVRRAWGRADPAQRAEIRRWAEGQREERRTP